MSPQAVRALVFIREEFARTGVSPSMQAIADRLGTGKSTAFRLVDMLIGAGLVAKQPGMVRGLRVVGQPDLRTVSTDELRAELARRGLNFEGLPENLPPQNIGRTAKTCAASYCRSSVQPGHLFCRPHWYALPQDLRDDIFRAFRAKDQDAYADAFSRARDITDTVAA